MKYLLLVPYFCHRRSQWKLFPNPSLEQTNYHKSISHQILLEWCLWQEYLHSYLLSYTRKTLGDSEDKPKAPEIYKCCNNPQITYLAPVNINIDERTIGSVDVWRCAACMKAFCEEKTLGIDSISDIVGMPRIEDNEKWAVVVSKLQKGKDKFMFIKLL